VEDFQRYRDLNKGKKKVEKVDEKWKEVEIT